MRAKWLAWSAALLFSSAALGQDAATALRAQCDACHSASGVSAIPLTPHLAGQPKVFLETQLVLIREGMRPLPAMQGMLDKVSDETIIALAKYYSALPAPSAAVTDAARVERGKKWATDMLCGACHLPTQVGREQVPRLAGQREDYLLAVMKAFRDNKAPGRDTQMQNAMRGVSDAQIEDLAHFLATLK
jgi:cytochrome c553